MAYGLDRAGSSLGCHLIIIWSQLSLSICPSSIYHHGVGLVQRLGEEKLM